MLCATLTVIFPFQEWTKILFRTAQKLQSNRRHTVCLYLFWRIVTFNYEIFTKVSNILYRLEMNLDEIAMTKKNIWWKRCVHVCVSFASYLFHSLKREKIIISHRISTISNETCREKNNWLVALFRYSHAEHSAFQFTSIIFFSQEHTACFFSIIINCQQLV